MAGRGEPPHPSPSLGPQLQRAGRRQPAARGVVFQRLSDPSPGRVGVGGGHWPPGEP